MKKKIIVLALSGCMVLMGRVYAQTPLFSTSVNESLKSMINPSGKFNKILWSNGQTTLYEDIGSGGGDTGSWTSSAGKLTPKTIADLVGIGTTTLSAQFTVVGSATVTGTMTTTGNRVFGTNTTTTIGGSHVFAIPGSGTKTVSNADIYALSGVSSGGALDTQLGNKVNTVNGSATDLTVTRLTVLGSLNSEGNIQEASGSWTTAANGTNTVEAIGANNILLKTGVGGQVLINTGSSTYTTKGISQVYSWGGTYNFTGISGETVIKTISVPSNIMGNSGEMLIGWMWSANTNTVFNKSWKVYVYDGVSTSTVVNRANNTSVNASAQMARFLNIGSTSSNLIAGNTSASPYSDGTTSSNNTSISVNTANPLTVSFAVTNGSDTTQTITLNHFKVTTNYAD